MNNSNEKRARRIASLLAGYIRDTLTPVEHDELDEWVGASDKNMRLFEELTDEKRIQMALELLNDNSENGILSELQDDVPIARRRVVWLNPKKIAVAASIALVLGLSGYLIWKDSNTKPSGSTDNTLLAETDLPPTKDIAILQTVDREIDLGQINDGNIAMQGFCQITKKNNEITYTLVNNDNQATQIVQYNNTVKTPRGGKYKLVLSDGTIVWLNSGSSITYPAIFIGEERRVTISGEVFFDVASARKPGPNYGRKFIVQSPEKNMAIEVMGTRFNISAYPEEKDVKTILVEGSVKITAGTKSTMMVPGDQAIVSASGDINTSKIDTMQALNWRRGIINATGKDLGSTMQKVARAYGAELDFEDDKLKSIILSGTMVTLTINNTTLSQLLDAIRPDAPGVRFDIVGKKIIVKPS